MHPRRGDIYLVEFGWMNCEPARANEANKQRPSIIVTNNSANINGSSVVVIPLSGTKATIYPFQVLLPNQRTNLESDSKALPRTDPQRLEGAPAQAFGGRARGIDDGCGLEHWLALGIECCGDALRG